MSTERGMMTETMIFPKLEARNLESRRFMLPDDFAGTYNVAIVAFRRWHQALVDSWSAPLRRLRAAYPDLRAYELPMLSSPYAFARFFIDGGMAAAIPDREVRAATLTVYTDVQQVARALQIPATDTIHLFLVDRAGQISWRGRGEYDEWQYNDLEQTVSKQTSASP
jgi:hypothetical protein